VNGSRFSSRKHRVVPMRVPALTSYRPARRNGLSCSFLQLDGGRHFLVNPSRARNLTTRATGCVEPLIFGRVPWAVFTGVASSSGLEGLMRWRVRIIASGIHRYRVLKDSGQSGVSETGGFSLLQREPACSSGSQGSQASYCLGLARDCWSSASRAHLDETEVESPPHTG
jgi:hypothetical protein